MLLHWKGSLPVVRPWYRMIKNGILRLRTQGCRKASRSTDEVFPIIPIPWASKCSTPKSYREMRKCLHKPHVEPWTSTYPCVSQRMECLPLDSHSKNQGQNTNSLEIRDTQSQSLQKMNQQKIPDNVRVTRERSFWETDLFLITTCSNAQRKPEVHTETITTSVGQAEEDAGSGRFLYLGLLKIPAFNSCLFL